MEGNHLIVEENITITPRSGSNLNFILSESETANAIEINVQNSSDESISDLGIFLHTASTCGTWKNPPDNPPATDYQDAIKWGSKTVRLGEGVWSGGFKVYLDPTNSDPAKAQAYEWIRRDHGMNWRTRIKINPTGENPLMEDGISLGEPGRLGSGAVSIIKIEFVPPPDIDSRRLYVRFEVGA